MFCGPVVVSFVNCFVIVCNMSQKVFRDCLDKKYIYIYISNC